MGTGLYQLAMKMNKQGPVREALVTLRMIREIMARRDRLSLFSPWFRWKETRGVDCGLELGKRRGSCGGGER